MNRAHYQTALLSLVLLVLAACGQEAATSSPQTDAVVETGERIVVLGGEIAETLVRLGVEDRIVAVDSTSTWPARLRNLPNVGYLRQMNTEGVLSLQPDRILASHDAGPIEVLERWRQLGIEVHQITTGPEIELALASMAALGEITGKADIAAELIAENRRALNALSELESTPRVLFILSKSGNLPLISGSGTKAHVMIETAGGRNVAATMHGYKPVTAEAIVKLAPDIILVASHGIASFGDVERLKQDPALRLTPAVRNDQVQVIDSQLMLSMGPRLGEAVTLLHAAFADLYEPQTAADGSVAQRDSL